MASKRPSTPPGCYTSAFSGNPGKILSQHGDKDLLNEIELLRYMNLVVLQEMNAVQANLTFQDHLAALRAVTFSAGRIAHLVDVQYRVFSPRAQLEQAHQEQMESLYTHILEIAEGLMGKKRVGKIEFTALIDEMHARGGMT